MSTAATPSADSVSTPFQATALTASITVKDLETSLGWYRDVLGFTVDQNYEREGVLRAVALRAGDVRILINLDDGGRGWERVKGEGISLQFTTEQNIDAVAERIRAAGGTLDTEPADMPWGARVFRVHDPDGYRFAISSPRKV
jgi:uncharacterized glyoxalase superfamily protein PhnB